MSLTNKALFIIERNLTSALTLASIAENCEASRFHLAHAFGKSTGLSVTEYLRCRRLTQAAYALAAGANDILSVALDSGYASHEAFSRAFKAQFGETVRGLEKAVRNSSTHTIAATSARSSIVDSQWAHRQPHGPLQSLPPTILPRATTVMLGGSQKTGRSRAWAFKPK